MTAGEAKPGAARPSEVAAYLRAHKQEIGLAWEADVTANLAKLRELSRPALIDHVPEVLDAIAAWIEGRHIEAELGFQALADGHALQRLAWGVETDTLATEYGRLRHVMLTHLLDVESTPQVRQDLVALNTALDLAVNEAMRIYRERRNALRERFLAILAHDLRSPLSSVLMAADALLHLETLDARATAFVVRIARSGKRMQRMIDSVIEFARGHFGGGIPLTPTTHDMADLCRAAADEYRSGHPDVELVVDVTGDLRGAWDGDRVHQALANLLGNAGHYGKGAPVILKAWEHDDRRHVSTSVTNFGPKIPPEAMPTLFDPFSRGDASARQGLGLGLYIVQLIAAGHGARWTVDSAADTGTTFTITWPRTPPDEVPDRP